MKVLILAAGYGTRLASVAGNMPKPLIPIGQKPIIGHVIDKILPEAAITEIVVVTNNKFYDTFTDWAKTVKGKKVRIVNDQTNNPEERLGSIGDMRFVWQKETSADDWLIIGGDNLFDAPLTTFVDFAITHKPDMTIGIYDIHDIAGASKFGVVSLGDYNKINDFVEKPANPSTSLIAMCLYYFPKETLGYIDEYAATQKNLDTAGSYIQWLIKNKSVYGFQFSGKWYDIGSVESLNEAREAF